MPIKYPKLSIIVPTLNNGHGLEYFFKTIHDQLYDQKQIEILLIDGGSTDNTREIGKKHGATIIHNPHILAEPAVALGMESASGDLMMILATDNIFKHKTDLDKMVSVFEDADIYAALPKQDYDYSDNLLTKYHNTFTDPFNHFVYGYASNTRTFNKVFETIKHTDIFDVYDFASSELFPMISFSQGFTIRRDYRRNKNDFLDDVTPVMNLIKKRKLIAYVHSVSVFHHTIKNISHFIKKQRWATQNALEGRKYGISYRLKKLSKMQQIKTYLWPLYSMSIIFPIIRSLIGFIKDKEPLWLIHPLECLLCAYANAIQLLEYNMNKFGNSTRTISRQ